MPLRLFTPPTGHVLERKLTKGARVRAKKSVEATHWPVVWVRTPEERMAIRYYDAHVRSKPANAEINDLVRTSTLRKALDVFRRIDDNVRDNFMEQQTHRLQRHLQTVPTSTHFTPPAREAPAAPAAPQQILDRLDNIERVLQNLREQPPQQRPAWAAPVQQTPEGPRVRLQDLYERLGMQQRQPEAPTQTPPEHPTPVPDTDFAHASEIYKRHDNFLQAIARGQAHAGYTGGLEKMVDHIKAKEKLSDLLARSDGTIVSQEVLDHLHAISEFNNLVDSHPDSTAPAPPVPGTQAPERDWRGELRDLEQAVLGDEQPPAPGARKPTILGQPQPEFAAPPETLNQLTEELQKIREELARGEQPTTVSPDAQRILDLTQPRPRPAAHLTIPPRESAADIERYREEAQTAIQKAEEEALRREGSVLASGLSDNWDPHIDSLESVVSRDVQGKGFWDVLNEAPEKREYFQNALHNAVDDQLENVSNISQLKIAKGRANRLLELSRNLGRDHRNELKRKISAADKLVKDSIVARIRGIETDDLEDAQKKQVEALKKDLADSLSGYRVIGKTFLLKGGAERVDELIGEAETNLSGEEKTTRVQELRNYKNILNEITEEVPFLRKEEKAAMTAEQRKENADAIQKLLDEYPQYEQFFNKLDEMGVLEESKRRVPGWRADDDEYTSAETRLTALIEARDMAKDKKVKNVRKAVDELEDAMEKERIVPWHMKPFYRKEFVPATKEKLEDESSISIELLKRTRKYAQDEFMRGREDLPESLKNAYEQELEQKQEARKALFEGFDEDFLRRGISESLVSKDQREETLKQLKEEFEPVEKLREEARNATEARREEINTEIKRELGLEKDATVPEIGRVFKELRDQRKELEDEEDSFQRTQEALEKADGISEEIANIEDKLSKQPIVGLEEHVRERELALPALRREHNQFKELRSQVKELNKEIPKLSGAERLAANQKRTRLSNKLNDQLSLFVMLEERVKKGEKIDSWQIDKLKTRVERTQRTKLMKEEILGKKKWYSKASAEDLGMNVERGVFREHLARPRAMVQESGITYAITDNGSKVKIDRKGKVDGILSFPKNVKPLIEKDARFRKYARETFADREYEATVNLLNISDDLENALGTVDEPTMQTQMLKVRAARTELEDKFWNVETRAPVMEGGTIEYRDMHKELYNLQLEVELAKNINDEIKDGETPNVDGLRVALEKETPTRWESVKQWNAKRKKPRVTRRGTRLETLPYPDDAAVPESEKWLDLNGEKWRVTRGPNREAVYTQRVRKDDIEVGDKTLENVEEKVFNEANVPLDVLPRLQHWFRYLQFKQEGVPLSYITVNGEKINIAKQYNVDIRLRGRKWAIFEKDKSGIMRKLPFANLAKRMDATEAERLKTEISRACKLSDEERLQRFMTHDMNIIWNEHKDFAKVEDFLVENYSKFPDSTHKALDAMKEGVTHGWEKALRENSQDLETKDWDELEHFSVGDTDYKAWFDKRGKPRIAKFDEFGRVNAFVDSLEPEYNEIKELSQKFKSKEGRRFKIKVGTDGAYGYWALPSFVPLENLKNKLPTEVFDALESEHDAEEAKKNIPAVFEKIKNLKTLPDDELDQLRESISEGLHDLREELGARKIHLDAEGVKITRVQVDDKDGKPYVFNLNIDKEGNITYRLREKEKRLRKTDLDKMVADDEITQEIVGKLEKRKDHMLNNFGELLRNGTRVDPESIIDKNRRAKREADLTPEQKEHNETVSEIQEKVDERQLKIMPRFFELNPNALNYPDFKISNGVLTHKGKKYDLKTERGMQKLQVDDLDFFDVLSSEDHPVLQAHSDKLLDQWVPLIAKSKMFLNVQANFDAGERVRKHVEEGRAEVDVPEIVAGPYIPFGTPIEMKLTDDADALEQYGIVDKKFNRFDYVIGANTDWAEDTLDIENAVLMHKSVPVRKPIKDSSGKVRGYTTTSREEVNRKYDLKEKGTREQIRKDDPEFYNSLVEARVLVPTQKEQARIEFNKLCDVMALDEYANKLDADTMLLTYKTKEYDLKTEEGLASLKEADGAFFQELRKRGIFKYSWEVESYPLRKGGEALKTGYMFTGEELLNHGRIVYNLENTEDLKRFSTDQSDVFSDLLSEELAELNPQFADDDVRQLYEEQKQKFSKHLETTLRKVSSASKSVEKSNPESYRILQRLMQLERERDDLLSGKIGSRTPEQVEVRLTTIPELMNKLINSDEPVSFFHEKKRVTSNSLKLVDPEAATAYNYLLSSKHMNNESFAAEVSDHMGETESRNWEQVTQNFETKMGQVETLLNTYEEGDDAAGGRAHSILKTMRRAVDRDLVPAIRDQRARFDADLKELEEEHARINTLRVGTSQFADNKTSVGEAFDAGVDEEYILQHAKENALALYRKGWTEKEIRKKFKYAETHMGEDGHLLRDVWNDTVNKLRTVHDDDMHREHTAGNVLRNVKGRKEQIDALEETLGLTEPMSVVLDDAKKEDMVELHNFRGTKEDMRKSWNNIFKSFTVVNEQGNILHPDIDELIEGYMNGDFLEVKSGSVGDPILQPSSYPNHKVFVTEELVTGKDIDEYLEEINDDAGEHQVIDDQRFLHLYSEDFKVERIFSPLGPDPDTGETRYESTKDYFVVPDKIRYWRNGLSLKEIQRSGLAITNEEYRTFEAQVGTKKRKAKQLSKITVAGRTLVWQEIVPGSKKFAFYPEDRMEEHTTFVFSPTSEGSKLVEKNLVLAVRDASGIRPIMPDTDNKRFYLLNDNTVNQERLEDSGLKVKQYGEKALVWDPHSEIGRWFNVDEDEFSTYFGLKPDLTPLSREKEFVQVKGDRISRDKLQWDGEKFVMIKPVFMGYDYTGFAKNDLHTIPQSLFEKVAVKALATKKELADRAIHSIEAGLDVDLDTGRVMARTEEGEAIPANELKDYKGKISTNMEYDEVLRLQGLVDKYLNHEIKSLNEFKQRVSDELGLKVDELFGPYFGEGHMRFDREGDYKSGPYRLGGHFPSLEQKKYAKGPYTTGYEIPTESEPYGVRQKAFPQFSLEMRRLSEALESFKGNPKQAAGLLRRAEMLTTFAETLKKTGRIPEPENKFIFDESHRLLRRAEWIKVWLGEIEEREQNLSQDWAQLKKYSVRLKNAYNADIEVREIQARLAREGKREEDLDPARAPVDLGLLREARKKGADALQGKTIDEVRRKVGTLNVKVEDGKMWLDKLRADSSLTGKEGPPEYIMPEDLKKEVEYLNAMLKEDAKTAVELTENISRIENDVNKSSNQLTYLRTRPPEELDDKQRKTCSDLEKEIEQMKNLLEEARQQEAAISETSKQVRVRLRELKEVSKKMNLPADMREMLERSGEVMERPLAEETAPEPAVALLDPVVEMEKREKALAQLNRERLIDLNKTLEKLRVAKAAGNTEFRNIPIKEREGDLLKQIDDLKRYIKTAEEEAVHEVEDMPPSEIEFKRLEDVVKKRIEELAAEKKPAEPRVMKAGPQKSGKAPSGLRLKPTEKKPVDTSLQQTKPKIKTGPGANVVKPQKQVIRTPPVLPKKEHVVDKQELDDFFQHVRGLKKKPRLKVKAEPELEASIVSIEPVGQGLQVVAPEPVEVAEVIEEEQKAAEVKRAEQTTRGALTQLERKKTTNALPADTIFKMSTYFDKLTEEQIRDMDSSLYEKLDAANTIQTEFFDVVNSPDTTAEQKEQFLYNNEDPVKDAMLKLGLDKAPAVYDERRKQIAEGTAPKRPRPPESRRRKKAVPPAPQPAAVTPPAEMPKGTLTETAARAEIAKFPKPDSGIMNLMRAQLMHWEPLMREGKAVDLDTAKVLFQLNQELTEQIKQYRTAKKNFGPRLTDLINYETARRKKSKPKRKVVVKGTPKLKRKVVKVKPAQQPRELTNEERKAAMKKRESLDWEPKILEVPGGSFHTTKKGVPILQISKLPYLHSEVGLKLLARDFIDAKSYREIKDGAAMHFENIDKRGKKKKPRAKEFFEANISALEQEKDAGRPVPESLVHVLSDLSEEYGKGMGFMSLRKRLKVLKESQPEEPAQPEGGNK